MSEKETPVGEDEGRIKVDVEVDADDALEKLARVSDAALRAAAAIRDFSAALDELGLGRKEVFEVHHAGGDLPEFLKVETEGDNG